MPDRKTSHHLNQWHCGDDLPSFSSQCNLSSGSTDEPPPCFGLLADVSDRTYDTESAGGASREETMKLDVLGLQAFLTIVERGSFHAAASHLNLSQTALSHRIRKLEEMLSTELLIRTTRQVSLTVAGTALVPYARRAFAEIEGALAEMRRIGGAHEQHLSVGCLPTIAMTCLPEAVARFTREHPAIHLRIHDNSASEIAEKVHTGEVEIGVTIVAANPFNLDLKAATSSPASARSPSPAACCRARATTAPRCGCASSTPARSPP
jgi:DNA-binding transcriptional LysR family regulator